MDCDLQSTGLRPQPARHTCTFWFPPCQLSGTFSYGYIPVIIHVFVQFVQQLRFRYFQAAVYCITINALCFPVSTYHLVFEPYFHFPLGSLSGTEHLRPPTLNEQPALYIPYGNTKKQNNPRAHSYQSPAPYSSDRLCMNDGNLIPPAAKIVPDVTSYRVSLSVGKEEEEKKKICRRNLTWSTPPPPAFAHSHSQSLRPFNKRGIKVELHCLKHTAFTDNRRTTYLKCDGDTESPGGGEH